MSKHVEMETLRSLLREAVEERLSRELSEEELAAIAGGATQLQLSSLTHL